MEEERPDERDEAGERPQEEQDASATAAEIESDPAQEPPEDALKRIKGG